MQIWFGIDNGQISSNFDSYLPETNPYFLLADDNLSKCQGILTKLSTCINVMVILFGIANGQISSVFDRVMCLLQDNGRVLIISLTFLLRNMEPLRCQNTWG